VRAAVGDADAAAAAALVHELGLCGGALAKLAKVMPPE